tara:strand:+ start:743 stop:1663 length:921 start_codon:yes stop_codon:yes gene_type:complete
MSYFLIFIFSIFFSYFFLKNIIPYLSKDFPNQRSLHDKPVARGGGIVFLLISIVTLPFSGFYSIFLFLPLALVSFLDDLFSISPKIRYLIHFSSVFLILITNFNFFLLDKPILNFLIYLILLLIGTSIINFSNFMDGINGLLTSTIAITFINVILIKNPFHLYPILGSLLVFYFFNKTPAKVFMGDIGSTFLGALLFLEIISARSLTESFMILAVSLPIFIDAFSCVIRRFLNGDNIFKAHKKHLYQRLVSAGYSHSRVANIYSCCCIIITLTCLTQNIIMILCSIIMVILFGVIMEKYVAKPFNY